MNQSVVYQIGLLKQLSSFFQGRTDAKSKQILDALHKAAEYVRKQNGIDTNDPNLGANATLDKVQSLGYSLSSIPVNSPNVLTDVSKAFDALNLSDIWKNDILVPATAMVNPQGLKGIKVPEVKPTTTPTVPKNVNVTPTAVSTILNTMPEDVKNYAKQSNKQWIREIAPKYGVNVEWDDASRRVKIDLPDNTSKFLSAEDFKNFGLGEIYKGYTLVDEDKFAKMFNLKPINTETETGSAEINTPEIGTPEVEIKEGQKPLSEFTIPELQWLQQEAGINAQIDSYQDILKGLDSVYQTKANEIDKVFFGEDGNGGLLGSAIQNLKDALNTATQALASQKGAMDESARLAMAEVDKAVAAASEKSKSEMAARGIYFSGLTTRALNQIEAQGVSEKSKIQQDVLKYKAEIDMQIAVMTANEAMSEAQIKNDLMAKAALQKLELFTQNEDKKQAIKEMIAGLDAQIKAGEAALPYANELQRRMDEAAAIKDEEERQQKMFENNLKIAELAIKQQNADTDAQKAAATIWQIYNNAQIDWEKLGVTKQQMMIDTGLKLGEMFPDLDLQDMFNILGLPIPKGVDLSAYKQLNKQKLQQVGSSGGGSTEESVPEILKMTPAQLQNFIKSIDSSPNKVKIDENTGNTIYELDDNQKAIKNLAQVVLNLKTVGANTGDASFTNLLVSVAPTLSDDVKNQIIKVIPDNTAKAITAFIFATNGNAQDMQIWTRNGTLKSILEDFGGNTSSNLFQAFLDNLGLRNAYNTKHEGR